MILVDTNLLVYAFNPESEHHEKSAMWLTDVLSSPHPVRFAWSTLLGFIRIMTDSRVFQRPLSGSEAMEIVDGWLDRPSAGIIEPGERYREILRDLIRDAQIRGPLVMDAHLAALAIEHGAELHTNDRDFLRFSGLRTAYPVSSVE